MEHAYSFHGRKISSIPSQRTQAEWNVSRLAFFAVKNNVIVLYVVLNLLSGYHSISSRALRAMAAEFVFFIGIAAICFSGLLFTLHSLGKCDYTITMKAILTSTPWCFFTAADKWSVKAIAWLMVQIWFGNTYLSFGQAESFHPVFGPILMTCFAALSNTLLLTSECRYYELIRR